MAWGKLLELGQELFTGLMVVAQSLDGDPALGEQVVERRGAVRLLDVYELAGRPERVGDLQPASAQALRVHSVLVEQHVPVLPGDLLVVPVFVMIFAPAGGLRPRRQRDARRAGEELSDSGFDGGEVFRTDLVPL